jgi:Cupin-like domain
MDVKLRAIPEWHHVDDRIFNEEILEQYRPAVLRGLVKQWPVVQHGLQSPESVCKYLKTFDNGSVVNAIMTAPEVRGRKPGRRGAQYSTTIFSMLRKIISNIFRSKIAGFWVP